MTACRACSRPGPRLVHLRGKLRRQCDAELHLAVPTAAGRSRHVAAALEARHVDHDCGRGRAAPGSRAAARTARDHSLAPHSPLRGPGLTAVSGLMLACPTSRLGSAPALPNVHRIAAVAAGRPGNAGQPCVGGAGGRHGPCSESALPAGRPPIAARRATGRRRASPAWCPTCAAAPAAHRPPRSRPACPSSGTPGGDRRKLAEGCTSHVLGLHGACGGPSIHGGTLLPTALGQPAPRRCSPCGAARRLRLAPRRKARTPRRRVRLARGRPWGALGLGAATAAPTPPATGRPGQRCLPRPKPKPAGSLRPGPWARPGPTGSARGLQPEPLALQRPNWRPRGGRGPSRGWRLPQARDPAAGSAVVAACRRGPRGTAGPSWAQVVAGVAAAAALTAARSREAAA